TCKMSNTPLVKTSFFLASPRAWRSMSSSSRVRIFFRIGVKLKLYERKRAKGKAPRAKKLRAKRKEAALAFRPLLLALCLLPLPLCSSRNYHLLFTDCDDAAFSRRKRSDSCAPRAPRSSTRACRKRVSEQIRA